jgi:hypothetical protein
MEGEKFYTESPITILHEGGHSIPSKLSECNYKVIKDFLKNEYVLINFNSSELFESIVPE